ncbi:MAG: hypothetical protein AAGK21_18160 [Bacteroidota bacterium]
MSRVLLTLAAGVCLSAPSLAQSYGSVPPRIGVGFDVASAVLDQDLIPDFPSIGIRGRVALPVNADVSVAASIGIGAHVFDDRSDARYVVNPQAEVIVTLPRSEGRSVRYAMGGFGGYVPIGDGGGGPSVHLGYGWAIPLQETSVFAEVNPALLIGEDTVVPVIAGRLGVIF